MKPQTPGHTIHSGSDKHEFKPSVALKKTNGRHWNMGVLDVHVMHSQPTSFLPVVTATIIA